jgi:hypothetical protein
MEECGPCPVFASYTLAFALQLSKKHRKTSVREKRSESEGKSLSLLIRTEIAHLDLK